MKVVMITAFPPNPGSIRGGVAGVSVYLTSALSRIAGMEVEVIVPDAPIEAELNTDFNGMKVHYLPLARCWPAAMRLLWLTPRAIAKKLSQLDFDIVHIQAVASWAKFLKCPYVLTIHGIAERDALFKRRFAFLRSRIVKLIEGRARHRAENIIVINPYILTELGDEITGHTCPIENPVADSFFEIKHRGIFGRVFYGGSIIPRKNIDGLIKAFATVLNVHPEAELRLAGHGSDSEYGRKCKQLVSKLGIEKKVKFMGSLTVEQMQSELSSASCMVLCSYQETAPVIICEAMAIGVPVVASNICGVPYMVEDGQTGKLVNPGDPSDIAAGISYILGYKNPDEMSRRAIAIAKERFRASVVAGKTYDFYKKVLGNV